MDFRVLRGSKRETCVSSRSSIHRVLSPLIFERWSGLTLLVSSNNRNLTATCRMIHCWPMAAEAISSGGGSQAFPLFLALEVFAHTTTSVMYRNPCCSLYDALAGEERTQLPFHKAVLSCCSSDIFSPVETSSSVRSGLRRN